MQTASNNNLKYCLLTIILSILVSSCDVIFETDLSDKSVQVVSPTDGAQITSGNVTFLWRRVAEARNYHVTVVSPSFKDAGRVITDTIIGDSINQFRINMASGDYQWSIRAFNSGYSTKEQVYDLKVE